LYSLGRSSSLHAEHDVRDVSVSEGFAGDGKKINRDEGDEKQKQAYFSLSPSSLLNNLSESAKNLNEAWERWLNPEGASESELKKRMLTNLYNEREAGRCAWLNHLHRELDRAVLVLNLERARLQSGGHHAGAR
jgi:hypothetical protein